jgi:catechol 2,3-dioxygenase-like lactoylglutathione lyase family enzyme
MTIQFMSVVPILRIFDVAKADEFYQGFLGFKVDWDHRFDDNAPLYRQVSRGDLILHLSEHHGDGSPGARLRVMMRGVEEFYREISAKNYRFMRPGLEKTPWGTPETGAIARSGISSAFASGSASNNLAVDYGRPPQVKLRARPVTRPAA